MNYNEVLLSYFQKELNPIFKEGLDKLIDERVAEDIIPNPLFTVEAQKEKKRQEMLKEYDFEAGPKKVHRMACQYFKTLPTMLTS